MAGWCFHAERKPKRVTKLASWPPKKRLVSALTGVLLIMCGATACWVVRQIDSHNDCAVVEQLGHQWIAMAQSVTALENGQGERRDLVAIADKESSMSDDIRAASGSVSSPALKNQLGKWAQGTALLANSQRDYANRPPQMNPSSGEDADYYHAAVMTYEAAQALLMACPNMPPVPPAN
ncbi:hypothetical protein F0Q45_20715 [Mycobacterium simiae]|uniref:Uncharacterized protein n=1 Tax=Mycobacterium simiae TaxID=1784 RepID=A0A5B1BN53_MYCSI|nr:hypothetical protein [Mycobacterium simiae]KAA1248419.1 hypothetical protein F0Q45_20715 [Mycobacterium simiae]